MVVGLVGSDCLPDAPGVSASYSGAPVCRVCVLPSHGRAPDTTLVAALLIPPRAVLPAAASLPSHDF